jgi:hypothetical protein
MAVAAVAALEMFRASEAAAAPGGCLFRASFGMWEGVKLVRTGLECTALAANFFDAANKIAAHYETSPRTPNRYKVIIYSMVKECAVDVV